MQSLHRLYIGCEIEHPMNLDVSKKFREIFTPKVTLWNVYLVYIWAWGFFYTLTQLLGQLKVTPKSFIDTFKEGNYERNMDALNDYFWGLCIASVASFRLSGFFPDTETISNAQANNGNINDVLLNRLKAYLQEEVELT
ncbi:Hypothetical predicted protein [Paramuricea clavata]|uniref:Uncharacterized protein n=1 Tax=Paramuricea clavata TaxID=317549 RepID=A0A6S7I4D6_PARCT|nr:Hypothetical predicted protein [Paramuricea clavata]